MNEEQEILLRALHDLISVNPNIVTDEQYRIYDELMELEKAQ